MRRRLTSSAILLLLLLSASAEAAPTCPIPLTLEQQKIVQRAEAIYKKTCTELVDGAFRAFLDEDAKRQQQILDTAKAITDADQKKEKTP